MILECRLTFEAAHRNLSPGAGARTRRVHGHSYAVTVAVRGPVDSALGWVRDFGDIKSEARSVVSRLDHQYLNEVPGITDATCGDVERWLSRELGQALPAFATCRVSIQGETEWNPIVSRGVTANLDVVRFGFAAAHSLPRLPKTHKCFRLHGHSFAVHIRCRHSPRVLDRLSEIYPLVDHHVLNEIEGLDNPTSELLAQWLWQQIAAADTGVQEIMIAETCTSACRYDGREE